VPTIDLVYFDAGGGHRAAALALQAVITRQQRPWTLRLVNLTPVLDPNHDVRRWLGADGDELYNRRLRSGSTFSLALELKLLQVAIRLLHPLMLKRLRAHWSRTQPDLVVSLVPNFNRVLYQSVRAALPRVPYVAVMTDLADFPPHFWMEPGQDQTLVCGSAYAAHQAERLGCDGARLVQTSGMPLRPAFYDEGAASQSVDERRAGLGLAPGRATGLVLFGGQGTAQMVDVARELDAVQLIFLTGHNTLLAERLRTLERSAPHAVLGFTEDVPGVMRLADFFIGKPGPGCLSEAVQMGLPIVTWRNASTLPQERYNAAWVEEQDVGRVIRRTRELPQAVAALLRDLPQHRAAAARIRNRAVFEIPEVFQTLLAARGGAAARPAHARDDRSADHESALVDPHAAQGVKVGCDAK
jgi:UDP-N-acetylglucosamine:LPS N-acetylglucosamine transferase